MGHWFWQGRTDCGKGDPAMDTGGRDEEAARCMGMHAEKGGAEREDKRAVSLQHWGDLLKGGKCPGGQEERQSSQRMGSREPERGLMETKKVQGQRPRAAFQKRPKM